MLMFNGVLGAAIVIAPTVLTLCYSKIFEFARKIPVIGYVLSCWWCTTYWLCGTFCLVNFISWEVELIRFHVVLILSSGLFWCLFNLFMDVKYTESSKIAGVLKNK